MTNVYSLNTIQFHWDGKDGVVRNNGKYGLLLTKPSIPSVLFDTVPYVSDVVGSAMDTKQNKVRLYILACTGVENVDFGLEELFPK